MIVFRHTKVNKKVLCCEKNLFGTDVGKVLVIYSISMCVGNAYENAYTDESTKSIMLFDVSIYHYEHKYISLVFQY
jgi:hypothetical protein